MLAIVLAAALALRLAYMLGRRGDILFDYPVVDEEMYVAAARKLAAGQGVEPRAWYQPPGLVYALATVFSLFGPGLLVPRIVQALVSTATCALSYLVARRLWSTAVAFGAAAVCAVHGVLVFECYELLPPTWMVAADMLALWALLRALERRATSSAFGAGAALGVAAVFGPTVLPFAVVALAALRRPLLAGAFVAGLALPVAPVAWGNWQRGNEIVLVSTNGGVNFFIGNNDRYPDTLRVRPGEHWAALEAEPLRAGAEGPGAQSAWFYARGLSFWRGAPGHALALYLRKLYLFFDGPEIPRDTDIYAMSVESGLLGLLVQRGPPWSPDGVLIPLALVGAIAAWPDRRRVWPAYAFASAQALVVAAFFVTSRYRVPTVPVLAMLACAGAARMTAATRRVRVFAAAGFAALALVLNVATSESTQSFAAELDLYRGLAFLRHVHRPDLATTYLERATAEDPSDARPWFELGNAFDQMGRTDEALAAWRRAGAADPWDGRPRRRVSVILAKHGDIDGAIGALREEVDSHARDEAYYASDHLNLALLYAERGSDEEAMGELRAAHQADPTWFRANIGGFAQSSMSNPRVDDAFRHIVAAAANGIPGAN